MGGAPVQDEIPVYGIDRLGIAKIKRTGANAESGKGSIATTNKTGAGGLIDFIYEPPRSEEVAPMQRN